MEKKSSIVEMQNLSLSFGGVQALSNVDLNILNGEILAIIGPNGAGKTSFFNCISGFYRPQRGNIRFRGEDLTKLSTHKIASLGIARTFQNIELYTGLSTLDNLMAARHILMKRGSIAGGLFFGPGRREELKHRREVEEIIDLMDMQSIRKKTVGALPYGMRKRVDLGRALCMDPEVLLLDEPMAGMNVEEKEDMARFILDIHELKRTTVVLVEHDMEVIMDIAERVAVLDFGIKIAEGEPEEIRNHEKVLSAYLGEQAV
ncbi:MAG: ABC transporter ATP-binding protein [Desulfatiglans sp.]|jgi:branched-chain amino acid transport system ATP-binding protein|nr:ABC transporter ATP-binding protein [Desulfatiglans sp.]